MQKVRQAAFVSIGRAVSFAGLGIFVVMVGLSFDPVLALRSGGVLILILLAGLLLRAQQVQRADSRQSEAWLLLDRTDRTEERAGKLTGALREALMWFARWTAGAAVVVWGSAAVFEIGMRATM